MTPMVIRNSYGIPVTPRNHNNLVGRLIIFALVVALIGMVGKGIFDVGRRSMALEVRQAFIENQGKMAWPFKVPETGVTIISLDKGLYRIEEER